MLGLLLTHLAGGVPGWRLVQHHILELGGRQGAALPRPGAHTRPRLLVPRPAPALAALGVRQTRQVGQTATWQVDKVITAALVNVLPKFLTLSYLLLLAQRVLSIYIFIFAKVNIPSLLAT